MSTTPTARVRAWLASLPMDASNDAHGVAQPVPEEMYTPERHATALAVETAIVTGGRGTGKSFWSGVLLDEGCRKLAAMAYPQLHLDRIRTQAGFTGLKGRLGVDRDKLDAAVPVDASLDQARSFWWATVLRALAIDRGEPVRAPSEWLSAVSPAVIDEALDEADARHAAASTRLVIVFDAVDTIASTWPRRRLLTRALLEVIWAFRAFRHVRPKLFIRRDQLEDDAIRYVELPKMRAGAVDLVWKGGDLYGMLFTRLYTSPVARDVHKLLGSDAPLETLLDTLRTPQWLLGRSETAQRKAMSYLSGDFMADGPHGKKKGTTWDWPLRHLIDGREEITPRAFLTLLIAAARSEVQPDRVLPPKGMRLDGMRAASRVRVEQLYEEIPWIKSALAPLSGLGLPVEDDIVHWCWQAAGTVKVIEQDAHTRGFLAPWSDVPSEPALVDSLRKLGVMMRRSDGRLDMPDLFRVAARLLKKGATAPV